MTYPVLEKLYILSEIHTYITQVFMHGTECCNCVRRVRMYVSYSLVLEIYKDGLIQIDKGVYILYSKNIKIS